MPEEDQRLVLKALEQVCQLAVGRKQVASGSHHVMSCQQLRLIWKTFIVLFASRVALFVLLHTFQSQGSGVFIPAKPGVHLGVPPRNGGGGIAAAALGSSLPTAGKPLHFTETPTHQVLLETPSVRT